MKIRLSILLGTVAIVAVLLALVLWSSKRANNKTAAAPPENPEEIPTQPVESMAQQPQSRFFGNEGPMVFYGKLEDQAAEPVADAEVIGTTVSHGGATAQFSTRSDGNGFFKLEAGIGESVKLIPQRPGYAPAATNNVEFYTHLRTAPPDPAKPVILKMWKLQGAEPLATLNGRYKLNATDTPVYFDFVAQTFVPTNGDIKITINRPPGTISPSERPDWSVEIEAQAGGGVMEITPENWGTTYWAPTDGYRPKLMLLMSTNAPQSWSQTASALFFVQTRDGGVYTKLALKVGINLNPKDPLDLAIYGAANTNGSCNLEGGPGS